MIPHLLEEAPEELERVASESRVLLAFDFDGTLSPIALTPDAARIHPAAAAALRRLTSPAPAGVRVAVVSGRALADLRPLVPAVHYLVGLHGLEMEVKGAAPWLRSDTSGADTALERLRARVDAALVYGARLEDKGHALAVHVRELGPEPARAAVSAFAALVEEERAAGAPLELLYGKAVVEARPAWAHKHLAIAEILTSLGGSVALAYVGDDATDEDVFRAYPTALTVAVMERPRPTLARSYLASPAEVATMIDRLLEARHRSGLTG